MVTVVDRSYEEWNEQMMSGTFGFLREHGGLMAGLISSKSEGDEIV